MSLWRRGAATCSFEKDPLRIARRAIEVDGVGARITEPKAGSRRTTTLPEPAVDARCARTMRAWWIVVSPT